MENASMYVKVDKHRELLATLKAIEAKLQGVDKTIDSINALKAEEDRQLGLWNENLSDIKARMGRLKEVFGG